MSQFPSVPPPGAYAPPNQTQGPPQAQGYPQQQPAHGYQPTQSPYGGSAPAYGPPATSHKSTNAFGQALNQAMTTGKPMLNKLGKTISSKLGSKPAHGIPQHLQSYQNYQQHQQQVQPPSYQSQGQQFNPQPTPQQSSYATPQQSPFAQSNYGTPASGSSGQNNYFPQQAPQAQNQPASPPQQPNATPNYNTSPSTQAGNTGAQAQGQPAYGQTNQNQGQAPIQQPQVNQVQSQCPPQPPQTEQYAGQQSGILGGQQPQPQSPPVSNAFPGASQPAVQQQQWAPPTAVSNSTTSPPPQQSQVPNPTPPPQQYNTSPPPPSQFNSPSPPQQQFNAAPPVPSHPSNQQQQQQQQQQWTASSPVSPQMSSFQPITPASLNPQPNGLQQNVNPTPQSQNQPHPQASNSQGPPPENTATEFVAELPADLGNLTSMENPSPEKPASSSPYQAYRPSGTQSTSPRPDFTVPRRAVSTSSLPLADPWRFADPATEMPTREFFIIADIIFDSLDRRFEPQNTGLLEASKLLESWKVQGLPEEAAQLFLHDSYIAFAKLWALEGIPHLMVPCEPLFTPLWNFQPQSHAHAIQIPAGPPPPRSTTLNYIPALNRAGFYKYFFLTMLHEPESLEKMVAAFCSDTYKPGILNQPDLQRRDKTPTPNLSARAKALDEAAVSRVCDEMAAVVRGVQTHGSPPQQQPSSGMTQEEMMLKMQSLQIQQQTNAMLNQTLVNGGISFSQAAGNTYTTKPNYGSFV